jgi:hypothetical protein
MPEIKDLTEGVTRTARDAAYVVVGLGVLGIQRAQVRRQELMKRLEDPKTVLEERLGGVRGEITKQVKAIDDALEQVIEQFEAGLEPIEERLPTQARDIAKQVHTYTREARDYVRNIVSKVAA